MVRTLIREIRVRVKVKVTLQVLDDHFSGTARRVPLSLVWTVDSAYSFYEDDETDGLSFAFVGGVFFAIPRQLPGNGPRHQGGAPPKEVRR